MEEENGGNLISKTFFWMFLGLLGTAIVAWYTYSSGLFISIILGNYWGLLLIAEVVVVLLFSFLFKKLPPVVVGILFFLYSMLNGVTLSTTFILFELNSTFVNSICILIVIIAKNIIKKIKRKTNLSPSLIILVFPFFQYLNLCFLYQYIIYQIILNLL